MVHVRSLPPAAPSVGKNPDVQDSAGSTVDSPLRAQEKELW